MFSSVKSGRRQKTSSLFHGSRGQTFDSISMPVIDKKVEVRKKREIHSSLNVSHFGD